MALNKVRGTLPFKIGVNTRTTWLVKASKISLAEGTANGVPVLPNVIQNRSCGLIPIMITTRKRQSRQR